MADEHKVSVSAQSCAPTLDAQTTSIILCTELSPCLPTYRLKGTLHSRLATIRRRLSTSLTASKLIPTITSSTATDLLHK